MDSTGENWQENVVTIRGRMEKLLDNVYFSDVKLVSTDSTIPIRAHKLILSASSSVWEKLFLYELADEDNVEINVGFNYRTIRSLIEYVYTDRIEKQYYTDSLKLIQCAKKYGISSLVEICENNIAEQMTEKSVLDILSRAVVDRNENITEIGIGFIDKCFDQMCKTKQFLDLNVDALIKILESNTLRAPEILVFKSVIKWASNHCRKAGKEVNAINRREMVDSFIKLIRFPCISAQDLSDEVYPTGILNDAEIRDLLYFQSNRTHTSLSFPYNHNERKSTFETFHAFLTSKTKEKSTFLGCECESATVYYEADLVCEKRIFLKGAFLQGAQSESNFRLKCGFGLKRGNHILYACPELENPYKLLYSSNIELLAGKKYKIFAWVEIKVEHVNGSDTIVRYQVGRKQIKKLQVKVAKYFTNQITVSSRKGYRKECIISQLIFNV